MNASEQTTPRRVPMVSVQVGARARALVTEALDRGQLVQGPMVRALEEAFAQVCGVEHCVAVSNGTVALQAALTALGIGPGDEVITTPLSFVATVNAVIATGARVRFADVTDDLTMDPDAAAALIGSSTAAILPVHLYGLPADLPSLQALTDRHGLALVEDAAQAHGAAVGGLRVGSFGTGCFSLYATKNVAAGEGGLVTSNDHGIADQIRLLRNQGMGQRRYDYRTVGWNWRMTDLHAAIALPQVEDIERTIAHRRRNAELLRHGLADQPGLTLPAEPEGRTSVWHQYTVQVAEGSVPGGGGRDELMALLAQHGVDSAVYYPDALPDVPPLREHALVASSDDITRARIAARRVLSVPVGHHLGDAQIQQVVAAVQKALS